MAVALFCPWREDPVCWEERLDSAGRPHRIHRKVDRQGRSRCVDNPPDATIFRIGAKYHVGSKRLIQRYGAGMAGPSCVLGGPPF
jgi:hypothetical protein